MTKTDSIRNFLLSSTHEDLARLYNHDMECQVNVAQDGGERVDGEFFGIRWQGWTDGLTTWKTFRIPLHAATIPSFNDKAISFDLAAHAEGIGMTGWDWNNKVSRWVAFDFDSLIDHKIGLTNEELEEIKEKASSLPWVTIRKSTSGKGLHFYVFLDNIPTVNHVEHAALARSIIGMMSALTGFDFNTKVDGCGGNIWVWHRKMQGTDGLSLIKQGTPLYEIPPNWRDHISVISGRQKKTNTEFDSLIGQRPTVGLDVDHIKLFNWFSDNHCYWYWDQDNDMLITHTKHLEDAHDELNFKGYFKTISTGRQLGTDYNCFLFPLRHGAWIVRRYTQGTPEHESWIKDNFGWTKCYYNCEPNLEIACKAFGGIEDPKGGFIFKEAAVAEKAAQLLNCYLNIPLNMQGRETKLKQHKDGRLIVELTRTPTDYPIEGWLAQSNGPWTKIFDNIIPTTELESSSNYDDVIRHMITTEEDYGWMIYSDEQWHIEPLIHIRIALKSLGYSTNTINDILGISILKPWKLVNKPFQPEYPGNREWNRKAAQLKYTPTTDTTNLSYPTWLKVLQHCGCGLDSAVKTNQWCIDSGIFSGADYLKCWIASLFQYPLKPLPYLFFYGPQNSGKSTFHESIELLLTSGYCRADNALQNKSGFNAELEGQILCVVEETDLGRDKTANSRMKDWVTGIHIPIHPKGKTPYHVVNTSHWVHTANSHLDCPVFPGDTRVTICYVPKLDEQIPKELLRQQLIKEASDFLAAVMTLELPQSTGRLNVDVIETADKVTIEQINKTPLEIYIEDNFTIADGYIVSFNHFYTEFYQQLEDSEFSSWSRNKVSRELPPTIIKGRFTRDGHVYLGNIKWKDKQTEKIGNKLTVINGYLEEIG